MKRRELITALGGVSFGVDVFQRDLATSLAVIGDEPLRLVAREASLLVLVVVQDVRCASYRRAIELRNGTKFLTLADVRDFILDQPEHIQERSFWQHAAELLINAADDGGDLEAATRQVELALFFEHHLVLR